MNNLLYTPPLISRLLKLTVLASLGATIVSMYWKFPIGAFLTLNSHFINDLYLWQPLTALVTLPGHELSFSYILDTCFVLFLFSLFGGQIYSIFSKERFLQLYIGSAIVGTIFATATSILFGFHQSVSLFPVVILGLATAWAIFSPPQQLMAFFFVPMPAKWFLVIALFGTIVNSALQEEYVKAAAYCGSFLYSYIVAIAFWHLRGPFESLSRFEAHLKRFSYAITTFWQWRVVSAVRKLYKIN